jgi:type I restriction enzyme S subunit
MTELHNLITDNIEIWTSAIKSKSSAGRGSSKKIELVGVKKLRELILELAVRGKLVPQDLDDEPASELLNKIEVEKDRLIKEGKIKKQKPLSPISDDQKPFELPIGWSFSQLDFLAWFTGGYAFKSIQYIVNGTRVIRISDFDERGLKNEKIVRYEYTDKLEPFLLEPNDLLMAMTGGTVGKSLLLDLLPEPLLVNQRVAGIRVLKGMCPRYLKYVFQTNAVQSVIEEAKNSTNDNISMGDIRGFLIPVPPEVHQSILVVKIDELMALCDQLEAQAEASIDAHKTLVEVLLATLTNAKDADELNEDWQLLSQHFNILFITEDSIEQLKQTILQLAVMGKLVKQDPNDEPACALLKNIAAEKKQLVADKVAKKQKALSEVVAEDKYFNVPGCWEWSRIGDASLFTEYGISAKTYDDIDGIPVLKMGDIQQGKVILGDHKKASADYPDIAKLMLKTGDVLYNRTNSAELVGKTGLFTGENDTYSFASYLIRIRCGNEGLLPEYLNLVMNTPLFRKTQIEPYLKQQCGQANVNGTIMKNMIIPVAPVLEQRRIVDKVNQLLDICEQLTIQISINQTVKVNLAEALVKQGFSH